MFLLYKLNNMSLSEKIGQLIMIDYRNVIEMNGEFEKLLTVYNPGGFILFKSNVVNFEQTKRFLDEIKNLNNIKPMIAVDQEGGRVQRLDNRVGFDKYPAMQTIVKNGDRDLMIDLGMKMGAELRAIGVDMNMAPVLDVFSNKNNQVIGDRAFGCNSEIVKQMALSYADGLKKSQIMAVGKHFPGHGDTLMDSHIDLPLVNKNLFELRKLELVPFMGAINNKMSGIMVGHIAIPKVTGNMLPASLSSRMINNLLRIEMGYKGMIISDSLKMKALTKYFSNQEIYLRCISAGNDILLMPQDIRDAYETIYKYVNEGLIAEERINDSVFRILSAKFDYGFFEGEYQEYIKYNKIKVRKLSKGVI